MTELRTVGWWTLILVLANSVQWTNAQRSTYAAGVVEFSPTMVGNDTVRTMANLREYINIIYSEAAWDLDVIVFPEGTLTDGRFYSSLPQPGAGVVPCNNATMFDDVVRLLSCAARDTRMYVVINLHEQEPCTDASQAAQNDTRPCAPNGLNVYNTNVVFDRRGAVVSRYRKWNLFGERGINTTATAVAAYFDTDFGVTFGHFICFDLMFYTPAIELIRRNITDFLFPTMWFSELPSLTAVQAQQNWAYTHNVNFLAAGASNPAVGSTGSGIYQGRAGALVSVMSSTPLRQLYVANVTRRGSVPPPLVQMPDETLPVNPASMDGLLLKTVDTSGYTTAYLQLNETTVQETLCSGATCCTFNLFYLVRNLTATQVGYHYRMAVFHGVRTFDGVATGGDIVCAVIACIDETAESCGRRFNGTATVSPRVAFVNVRIDGRFNASEMVLLMPTGVDVRIRPLTPTEFTYTESQPFSGERAGNDMFKNVTFSLDASRSDMLSFGIYGRDFGKDGWPLENNASHRVIANVYWLLVVAIVRTIYV